MGKTLTFVRHGESLANAGGLTMEDAVIPLTAQGHVQAQAAVHRLPEQPARVLSSPYLRARDTAQHYSLHVGASVQLHDRLHEFRNFDADLLHGMTGVQRRPLALAYWDQADPHQRMGPRAETFAEFDARLQAFIIQDLPTLDDGTVLFGHGRWIGLLLWKLAGHAAGDRDGMVAFWEFMRQLPMPNTAIYQLKQVGTANWQSAMPG